MLTIEHAIEQYENSERMNKELAETSVYPTAKAYYLESAEKCKQMIAWLRELQERRKADSCKGCKYIGQWENEYEYGLSCPCLRCRRRVMDNYESERRNE